MIFIGYQTEETAFDFRVENDPLPPLPKTRFRQFLPCKMQHGGGGPLPGQAPLPYPKNPLFIGILSLYRGEVGEGRGVF